MRENTYRTHQKILGALLIAYGALNFTGGIALLASINIVEIFVDEADIVQLVTMFSKFIGGALLFTAIPAIVAGIGSVQEKDWSKILSLIVGIIYLLFFPIGTLIGLYSIWLNAQSVIKEKGPRYASDLIKEQSPSG
jgi:Na+-driven multidrug efflux pump